MSDQVTSGEPTPATAATVDAAPAAVPVNNPAPIGSFGTSRGAGLARGKRPTPAAIPAASSASPSSEYKPTALEVITTQSEYRNPFASGTPANPVIEAPIAPAPAKAEPVATPVAEVVRAPVAPAPAPTPVVAVKPAEPAVKSELNILPPEEVKRPAVSWGDHQTQVGGDQRGRRDERSTFRPEKREPRPIEPREPRREPVIEQRAPLSREASVPTTPKSGGFFGWLKGLFGGKPAESAEPTRPEQESYRGGDQRQQHRRHHDRRGGYQGGNRDPRDSQPRDPRDGDQSQGERRFEGGGRRRRRGGRGRNRDDRGGPRSEGQQGGGAI